MKLENQVVSLKLAKKLEKLGVKQKSLWMWVKYELWKKPQVWQSDLATDVKVTCLSGKREYAYSAFTVAELINLLGKKFGVLERFLTGEYGAYIPNDCGVNGFGKKPQEALANLLINT